MERMRGIACFLLGAALVLTLGAQDGTKSIKPVSVARKVALVIGNSNYKYIQGVPPASADADDVAQAFRNLHFDVVDVKKDLTADALISEVGRFTRTEVQPGDLAVVYYSGHGGQVGEENYLLPVDYEPPSDDELVERRAYKMSHLRDALERTNARIRVLIFDACRNSPVTTSKGSTSGLRAMDGKPEGTLIAYASAHNQVARYDGSRNSFYTSELLPQLREPGVDLKAVFERVQNRVFERTSHQQTPYLYGFLSGPLYLAGAPASSNNGSNNGSNNAQPVVSRPSLEDDPAREAWQLAKDSKNRAMLEAVVREFPDTPYARLARVELAGMAPAPVTNTPSLPKVDTAALYAEADRHYNAKEYAAALPIYRQAADAGHALAMAMVGWLYDQGLGVQMDNAEGMRWFRKASDAGNINAMTNLAHGYLNGSGVAKDYAEALRWYRKAADGGNAGAMSQVGYIYGNGFGVPTNYPEAMRWYLKGAEAGAPTAMFNAGLFYENGTGVKADRDQAIVWYRKAAAAGNDGAKDALKRLNVDGAAPSISAPTKVDPAALYTRATERLNAKDYAAAMPLYREAADAGNASAMSQVGYMFGNGLGVPVNYPEALRWYLKGAEGGESAAMFNAALFYENGNGTRIDRNQAIVWYRKAAAVGNDGAKEALKRLGVDATGSTFSNPSKVDPEAVFERAGERFNAKDYAAALPLYRQAADSGHPGAITQIGYMYGNGLGVPLNYPEALRWYVKGAEAGSSPAMYNVALFYERGVGTRADRNQAIAWYRKAAAAGNDGAKQALTRLGVR